MGYKIDMTGQKFGRWTVIGFDCNKNRQTMWKCRCDCGTERSVEGARLRDGRSKSCGCLSRESTSLRSRKDITNQRFGRLVALYPTEERQSGKVVWLCKCDCGNEVKIPIDRLTGKNTQSCGCLSKEKASERFCIDLTGQTFGKLTVIKRDNTKNYKRVHWLCKCSCGNSELESVDGYYLRSGEKTQCSKCVPKSKGEEQIKNILIKNNISFTQEKSFDDCRFPKTNRLARFDFYIDNKYLIEFDGRQHIQNTNKWNNEWNLEYVQEHDQIKNNYCKEHNIPLIRIPYSKINYIKLEDLLLETSKYKI